MTEPISIIFISDMHLGKPSIDQGEMADAVSATLFPLLKDTDILFINGDFFDTVVNFDHYGFDPVCDTIFNLFSLCEDHKVILRILQGTWEHDRNQGKRFETFYRNGRYTFDFKFTSGIELDEIWVKNREIRVFYVPDDLPYNSSDEIVTVIENKLVDHGWDSVDYGCMHGYFEFNYPKAASREKVKVFDGSQFPFVKKIIDVGHVHQHHIEYAPKDRRYPDVISNGSFDRLNHGDESAKGLIRVQDYPDHYTAQFIENTHAAIWDTLYFTSDDTTETVRAKIRDHIASLVTRRKISLRFQVPSFELKDAIKSWMKDHHPDIAVKFKTTSDDDKRSLMVPSSDLFTPIEKRVSPTPKTIAAHIRAHITESYPLTTDAIDAYLETDLEKA